jgi:putative ABC transport system permease protein
VAIVNEPFAKQRWPGQSAVGKRFKLGQSDSDSPWITIVGVSRDIKQFGVRERTTDVIYLPFAQSPPRTATILVRAAGDPSALVGPARSAIGALDGELAVFGITTMSEVLARSIWQPRLQALLVAAFAVIALVLAAVGVYGVVSYAVAQRTREIGVRMALGALPSSVLRLVVAQGVRLTLVGVVLGLAGSLAAARLLQGLLFGVNPRDPITFAVGPLVLIVVAVVACFVPARRAARVDPSIALRAGQ